MAAAALAAWRVTGNDKYLNVFDRARGWFFGHNSLSLSLADPENGSCCDGLSPSGLNHNQGAESTLAYLWTELLSGELELNRKNEPSENSKLTLSSVD